MNHGNHKTKKIIILSDTYPFPPKHKVKVDLESSPMGTQASEG